MDSRLSPQTIEKLKPSKFMAVCLTAINLTLPTNNCIADSKTDSNPPKSEFELSWIATQGNTTTSTTNATLDLKKQANKVKYNLILKAFSSRSKVKSEDPNNPGKVIEKNTTTAEKYLVSAGSMYTFDEHSGLFVVATYEDDRFSGYDYHAVLASGYGNRLFSTENASLDYGIGLGYALNKRPILDENGIEVNKETRKYSVIRGSLSYLYHFSEATYFSQALQADVATDSDENSKYKSTSSLSAKFNDRFLLRASYIVNYNDDVVGEAEHIDIQNTLSIVYSF